MAKSDNSFQHRVWAICKDTAKQWKQAQLLLIASSLAYTTLLSIIPLLPVSFAIFQAFGGMKKLYSTVEPFILENLAQGSGEEVLVLLHRFIDNVHASTLGVTGLAALVVTSMSMLNSAEKAINAVWGAQITRTWFQRFSTYWVFITLGPLALAVLLGAASGSDLPMSRFFPSGTGMFFLTIGMYFSVYKWVPNCKVHFVSALVAAVFTTCLWTLARFSYVKYTQSVLTYKNVYGSLSAVPILLLWIYIVWIVILTGAALSAGIQKRFDLRDIKIHL
ncbi:MAG: YhjD/YihY/BrkB family envelope integrity protein [Bdellovibrionota bacterium]